MAMINDNSNGNSKNPDAMAPATVISNRNGNTLSNGNGRVGTLKRAMPKHYAMAMAMASPYPQAPTPRRVDPYPLNG